MKLRVVVVNESGITYDVRRLFESAAFRSLICAFCFACQWKKVSLSFGT